MVDQTYPKEGNTNTESQSQTNGLSLPVQYLCNLPEQHPRSTMDLFVKLSCQLLKRQSEAKEHFRQLIQRGCFLKDEKLSEFT